jgi:hypothetical protein
MKPATELRLICRELSMFGEIDVDLVRRVCEAIGFVERDEDGWYDYNHTARRYFDLWIAEGWCKSGLTYLHRRDGSICEVAWFVR